MGGDVEQPLQPQPQISPPGDASSQRRSAGRRRNFPTGTLVEVQTDEEGFKSVFFSATVITPPTSQRKSGRKKPKKLCVEYHNLLAHDDGSDRLKEFVEARFLRPRPPLVDTVKGFELDDVVDAFYKDGWWTGVVTRVVDGGERFVVTFNNPPDELEFGLTELRAHWDWVNGSWVRPQKQSITGLMFDVGRKVEVSFDREDSQEAWFPATIQEDMGNGVFLVEYNNANTNIDGLFTKVKVDSLHIRPCPPLLKDKNFVLLEKVDALFDLGWWSGVITKQLENSRYLVFFRQMKCDKEFNLSELRPQMEWKDGKWFTTQPQEPPKTLLDDGEFQHQTPKNSIASMETPPVKNTMDGEDTCGGEPQPSLISGKGHSEPVTPDNLKLAHVTIPMAKRKAHLSDSGGALSQPHKKLKEGNLVVANKIARHDGSQSQENISQSQENMICDMVCVAQTTLDQSSSNHPWEENIQRKQRNSRTPQNVAGKINATSSSLEKSCAEIVTVENLKVDVGEKEPDTEGNTEVVAQDRHGKQETGLPVVIGLPCAETGMSGFGISGGKRSRLSNKKTRISVDGQKEQVNESTGQKITDDKQSEIGESSEKKRRGRPKRNLVESTETPVTGNAENRDISSGNSNRKDDDSQRIRTVAVFGVEPSISSKENTTANSEKIANGQFAPGKRKARMTKRVIASNHEKDNAEESVRPEVSHPLKRGRRQISGGKISVKVRDLVGASGGKPAVVNDAVAVEEVIQQPNNEFDNEPLSKWIEGMNMSSASDGSKLLPVDTAVQCLANGDNNGGVLGEAIEKQPESEIQYSGLVNRGGDIAPTEPQSLPSVNRIATVVLDEATQKLSKSGTETASLVDKVSAVSELESLPSVDETAIVELDKGDEKQLENDIQATSMVDNSCLVSNQPLSSVEKAVDIALVENNEKQPENGTTVIADNSVSSQPRSSVEKAVDVMFVENNEKQPENGTTVASALADKVAVVPSDSETLPFVKNTFLWKTIESMEVFQKIPQMPHFRPLVNLKESSREGVAIGCMVTFSSLVERTSRLQLTDPTSTMFDIKDSLTDLEKHGFDIRAVVDSINQLLALKNNEEEFVKEYNTLSNQITEHCHEKTRINSEIEEINVHIAKLQKKLSLAKSAKEKEDNEISILNARLRETEQGISNVESKFDSIVSSIM